MSENAIDSNNISKPAPVVAQAKAGSKPAKKAKLAKKAGRAKAASKPKADRAKKKAEVIAMMKRAKGASLAEIMVSFCKPTKLAGRTSRADLPVRMVNYFG